MKICLLGDTHFGVRNDSKTFHKYYEKFYEMFFEYIDNNKIEYIIQLGDLFDRRKYINFLTLSESKKYFFDRIEKKGIKLISLLGNHDIFWKESLSVNSPELLLQSYQYIDIIHHPITIGCGGVPIDVIPWICKENENEIADFISKTTSKICVGHFEISGFEMMKGVPNHDGIDGKFLSKYTSVYSGHFHTASSKGNITYLGTPYELTWADYNDPKGFYVLDLPSNEIEFVRNPNLMFEKIYYNDEESQFFDYNYYADKSIKVIVVNKNDFGKFDQFIENLYKVDPAEVKIIEDMSEFESSAVDDNLNLEDTMTLLSEYVDGLETDADKQKLKSLLRELYVEAHDYEET